MRNFSFKQVSRMHNRVLITLAVVNMCANEFFIVTMLNFEWRRQFS